MNDVNQSNKFVTEEHKVPTNFFDNRPIKDKDNVEPEPTIVWWKNGDHPNDDVYRPFEDTGKKPTEPREGKVVRYFRHSSISGDSICDNCQRIMNDHGWIDNGGEGQKVCPGDYLKKDNNLY